ncbi:unnamed protein product [Peniophora sp. CBMAI 1063]|nr:unnamed protein product [Peniophora sp. CBMAI 1063]
MSDHLDTLLGDKSVGSIDITTDSDFTLPEFPESVTIEDVVAELKTCYDASNDLRYIETALHFLTDAVDTAAAPSPAWLFDVGVLLTTRYTQLGHSGDLDAAIAMSGRAVHLLPDDHPDEAIYRHAFGVSLTRRFRNSHNLEDLKDALLEHRRALELTLDSDTAKARRTLDVSTLLQELHERTGEVEDLNEAIALLQRSMELVPEDHPDFIATSDRGVDATSDGSSVLLAMTMGSLSEALHSRFEAAGRLEDLNECIEMQWRALELIPSRRHERSSLLHNLSSSLHSRFRRQGHARDLDDAITAIRDALRLLGDDEHPEKATYLSTLGKVFQSRFERMKDPLDIEHAVSLQRRALELTSDTHPDRPKRLADIGHALYFQYLQSNVPGDLPDAVAFLRRAVELTGDDHPELPMRLSNYSLVLHAQFDANRDLDVLSLAISTLERATELTDDELSSKPIMLLNLSGLYGSRYEQLQEHADLENAIVASRNALELMPEEHVMKVAALYNHGMALYSRFISDPKLRNFEAAYTCFMKATSERFGDPTWRLQAAMRCTGVWLDHPEFGATEAQLRAHARILELLPEIVWLGHSVKRRYEELVRFGRLVNIAVCAAILADNPHQAVEWFEAGRAFVWSQIFSLRVPVEDLQKQDPELALELLDIRSKLQRLGHTAPEQDSPPITSVNDITGFAAAATVEDRRRLVMQHDQIVNKIRRRPGFERFLLPQGFQDLTSILEEVEAGPVIFVNVAHALVLEGCTVKIVWLTDFTEECARELRSHYQGYLTAHGIRERAMVSSGRGMRGSLSDVFKLVLGKLWKLVAYPILNALDLLDNTSSDSLPHITWCPVGPITQLPLHAAGIYGGAQRGPCIFDYVVSSYTPSLSALQRCYSASISMSEQTSTSKVLVVTQAETPGQSPLPGTLDESARLRTIFPKGENTYLEGRGATLGGALEVLQQYPWVHFACHGSQNRDDPTQSAFHRYDGALTLSALMDTVSSNAEIAFLSACQTATGDEKIPEESAHLAAGMLAAGFKGVVATLWSIRDEDAPVVVEEYYKKLIALRSSGAVDEGQTGAACALHHAVKRLRDEVGESQFERWVPFVHFGV